MGYDEHDYSFDDHECYWRIGRLYFLNNAINASLVNGLLKKSSTPAWKVDEISNQ